MLVRIGFLKKKTNWRTEDFRAHWVSPHGPLARELPGLRHYVQNHVLSIQGVPDYPRGSEEFDGFSQLWFDDHATMRAAIATDLGRALSADEALFIGELRIAIAEQIGKEGPTNGRSGLKLMCLVERRIDVPVTQFHKEWSGRLNSLIIKLPGIRGVRHNLVVGREVPKGTPAAYDRLPVDAISELWFDSVEALTAAFLSTESKTMIKQSRGLVATMTPYWVECYVVM